MHTYARVHWNVILVTAIAALLVATLPQAAEAAPTKRQRCITAAERALGHDIRASDYRIVLGSGAYSETLWTSPRKDLICGFGGREIVKGIIGSGDIFISGAGSSRVQRQQGGLVIGSDGDNAVTYMSGGRFYGHVGFDSVDDMHGGVFRGGPGVDLVVRMHDGRFAGGHGLDSVEKQHGGVFLGERGQDMVFNKYGGRFKGGPQSDTVERQMSGGVFNGGSGTDKVKGYEAGTLFSVELCKKPKTACPQAVPSRAWRSEG